MKKNICSLMLMLLGISLTYAQEEASSFRLELSTQRISSLGVNSEDSFDAFIISKKTYNYSLHLSGFWDITKRLELGIGAGFSNRDAYFDFNCRYCLRPGRRPGNGFFVGSEGYVKRRALEVPIELRLNWFKDAKVIDPFVAFGLTNRLPIVYYSLKGEDKVKLDLESFGVGFSLLVGTKVNLGEKWGLVSSVALTRNAAYVLRNDQFVPFDDFNEIATKYEFWIKLGVRREF